MRSMNIELHQIEQLAVAHLGEQKLRAAFPHILDDLLFPFDQLVDAIFDRATTDELVHEHVGLLDDAKGTIGSRFSTEGFHTVYFASR